MSEHRKIEKELEEEEAWKAKMLVEMEKVNCNYFHPFSLLNDFTFNQFYQLNSRYSNQFLTRRRESSK